MTTTVYWLIASAAFLLLEAFGVPGIGFLFAGLAAILVAVTLALGWIAEEALIAQCAVFFLSTALSAVLLWKKLKTWRLNPNAPHYSNIIGTEAVVSRALAGSTIGEVKWSGTTMRARLADPNTAALPEGTHVRVTDLEGNVLIVTAKQ